MKRNFPKMILILLMVFSMMLPVGALGASANASITMPNVVSINDGGAVDTDGGTALPDDVRPEEVPGQTVGQVAGVTDEAPDGMSIFWGIVISLLVAGAVVVGIVMLVPKEEEEK